MITNNKSDDRQALRLAFFDTFEVDDLKNICFDLGIDHEEFDSKKSTFIREFLAYVINNRRYTELVDLIKSSDSWEPFNERFHEYKLKLSEGSEDQNVLKIIDILESEIEEGTSEQLSAEAEHHEKMKAARELRRLQRQASSLAKRSLSGKKKIDFTKWYTETEVALCHYCGEKSIHYENFRSISSKLDPDHPDHRTAIRRIAAMLGALAKKT